MSLDKAIEHGKEHRKPFRGSKAFDKTCRCHGTCDWCKENRMHKYKKRELQCPPDVYGLSVKALCTYGSSEKGAVFNKGESNMKKMWKIPVTWEMYGTVWYEADTIDEAIEKALNDDGPLPEGEYVDGSFTVSEDADIILRVYNEDNA